VLGTGQLTVIDDTVIIDRLDVELVSSVQLSVEAKSDFPGAIAAQVTKMYRLHSYLQVHMTCDSSLPVSQPLAYLAFQLQQTSFSSMVYYFQLARYL